MTSLRNRKLSPKRARRVHPMIQKQMDLMAKQGYVTPEEASRKSNVPRATIYRWAADGNLGETRKVGLLRVYVSLDAVLKLAGLVEQKEA